MNLLSRLKRIKLNLDALYDMEGRHIELDSVTKLRSAMNELNSIIRDMCWCHKCHEQTSIFTSHMIVCPDCGNKRCPKASDHELECTNSNEPGQPGSVYK